METNKLLTLEEIEELRIVNSLTDADARADLDSLMARLLATARAYWELKNTSKDIVDIDQSSVFGLPEDKPHLPTLKVIVEAMNEVLSRYMIGGSSLDRDDLATIAESLEKHLE